jgi:hypothetical protein
MAKNFCILISLLLITVCTCFAQQGDIRAAVHTTYASQIGVRELTNHNDGKEVEMYLRYCGLLKGEPWCASFVCWSFGQNEVKNPHDGFCPALFTPTNTIYKRGRKNNGIPLQSDVFGLYFPNKRRIAHVGFIETWGAKTVTTVEGNTNEGGSREGDGVYRKIRLTRQIYAVARYIKN